MDGFEARTRRLQKRVRLSPSTAHGVSVHGGPGAFSPDAHSSIAAVKKVTARRQHGHSAAKPRSRLARLSPSPSPSPCARGVGGAPSHTGSCRQGGIGRPDRRASGGWSRPPWPVCTHPSTSAAWAGVHLSETRFLHQETQGGKWPSRRHEDRVN